MASENAIVDSLIRDIKARQNIIKSVLIDEDEAQPLNYVGSYDLNVDIEKISMKITKTLDFDLQQFRNQSNSEEALIIFEAKLSPLIFV